MTQRGLIDIEEMVLRCRTEEARAVIEEAVACYKAGAYRAAIVATWLAVYFDLASKMKSLALAKNATAQQWLNRYEKHTEAYSPENSDTAKPLLNIENSILNVARCGDIELISRVELVDLKRLKADRNRCAHPTMQNADERFAPSAELARTHLRSAVEYVLSRPPIQGRLAAERFLTAIRFEGFPSTSTEAKEYLDGPLTEGLSENNLPTVVSALLSDMFESSSASTTRHQRLAALETIRSLFPNFLDAHLEELVGQQLEAVGDEDWVLVTGFLRHALWAVERLSARDRQKVRSAVAQADLETSRGLQVVWNSLHVPLIQPEAIRRLSELDLQELTHHRDEIPISILIDSLSSAYLVQTPSTTQID